MSDQPIVVIEGCAYHRPRQTSIVETGPAMVEMERERMGEMLLCPACWDKDPDGLQRLMVALGLSYRDRQIVKDHVEARRLAAREGGAGV